MSCQNKRNLFCVVCTLLLLFWQAELLPCSLVEVAAAEDEGKVLALMIEGDRALSRGRNYFQEAYGKYTEALIQSPKNTRALFSRAQVASRMRQYESALTDLNELLRISSGHIAGLELRSSLCIQEGMIVQAVSDLVELVKQYRMQRKPPRIIKETEDKANKLKGISHQFVSLREVLDTDPLKLPSLPAAREVARRKRFSECVTLLGQVIEEFGKESIQLRLKRAGCAVAIHQGPSVVPDLKYVLLHEPQNFKAMVYNAMTMRSMGALSTAKQELQRCLSIDPENGSCAKVFKWIRAEEKSVSKVKNFIAQKEFEKALQVLNEMANAEPNPPYAAQLQMWKCEVYVGLRKVEDGLQACGNALDSGSFNEFDIRMYMAELHIQNDDLQAAEAQVAVAKEIQPRHEKISEIMRKIENLRRNAGRKNYYKILGVPKTANEQEIRRAYRKLAKEHHPDKLRSKNLSDQERAKADELFRSINEAKEVLLDSEKRAAYDRGEDPNNPNAQGPQGPFYGQEFHFNGFPGAGFPGGGFPGGFPGGGFPGGGFPGGGARRQTFYFQQQRH